MSTTQQTTANSNPCLTLEVALVLISEKVHFWSDEQRDVHGKPLPARCLSAGRLDELRLSLMEIAGHCKSALAGHRKGAR